MITGEIKVKVDVFPTMEQIKRQYLIMALQHFGGMPTKVTKATGLDRKTVYRMIRKYKLEEYQFQFRRANARKDPTADQRID